MTLPEPIDLTAAIDALTFLPDRTPETPDTTDYNWATVVGPYRDGGIYAVHYAGESQWERHRVGDEVVMVLDGETTMTMLIGGQEHQHTMGPMSLIVVPEGTWHRFSTPDGVKVMTITPQPTDHQIAHPAEG